MAKKTDVTPFYVHFSAPSSVVTHQSGSVLLLLVTVLLASSIGGYWWYKQDANRVDQSVQRLSAMRDAKDRLLAFSESIPTIYANTNTKLSPGFFLCPDMDALSSSSAGSSNGSCSWSTGNAIGRLPTHKTTANGQYVFFSARSASGTDSFWYLIHNALRLGSSGATSFYYLDQNPVYDSMPHNLTLDGEPIVAAIIDAGNPLSRQTGRNIDLPAKQQWQEYIECVKPTTYGAELSQHQDITTCNDRIMVISKSEFDQHITQAVCELALESGWCLTYDSLDITHWFKQFHWGYSGNEARICHIDADGKPDGINRSECNLD